MKRFKLLNNIVGWIVFAIAAFTYLTTIEPTASFWDCGEFISSASKLEVGHPPGAPFFIITGRIFALFASDPTQIAAMINSLSAICSAFCILFLFWTITHLARRIIMQDDKKITLAETIAILGAGVVGALAYTWSDTFWFSAVEGEVYGYSSFFTAIVFWAILKWEDVAGRAGAERWIVLIAYLMGLSIGVHLLNLLTITAIVLVYYFKNYSFTVKGTLLAVCASAAIIVAVLYGLIPGCVKVASWFELMMVNGLGFHYNSGVLLYLVLLTGVTVWALYETATVKNQLRARIAFIIAIMMYGIPFITNSVILWVLIVVALVVLVGFVLKKINFKWLNFIVVCAMVMMIGYSSYAMIMIRSMANTPMDQNSPEDVFTLQSYLNREQYGDRPLLYGAVYTAPEVFDIKGNLCVPRAIYSGDIWQQVVKENPDEKDRYYIAGKRQTGYETDPRFNMLFPRMYSQQSHHVEAYKTWSGEAKGRPVQVDMCGRKEVRYMPSMAANLHFFFSYQVNFMYWRYFMWNFAGRQNDLQSHGEIDKGNWISGIAFLDNARLGDQDALPDDLRNNRGRNRYFMLPLLLGLLGIVWQLMNKKRGAQHFWIVLAFFFMTGLAIVVYLNQTPYQPRERDYAYAGSFYAFAIWIGLGVMFFYHFADKLLKSKAAKSIAAIVLTLVCLGVPAIMAEQNWDDHDRSDRRVARDFGLNYLNSCAENAVILCNGDNDTFPLWYNQEVEGNRTDVRVCNLSYVNTDWYIDQMKRQAYESDPLPINWERRDYVAGRLEASRVLERIDEMNLATALDLLRSPKAIDENGIGTFYAKRLVLPVDTLQAYNTGTLVQGKDQAVEQMFIPLGRTVSKAQVMVLEMLKSNNWERPLYVAATVGDEYYPQLKPYMQLEGLAYRIVPAAGERDRVNSDAMYDNMMNKFEWGNINNPKVYLDEQHMRMCRTMRLMFSMLIKQLVAEKQFDKAIAAQERCLEVLPETCVPVDFTLGEIMSYSYNIANHYDIEAQRLRDGSDAPNAEAEHLEAEATRLRAQADATLIKLLDRCEQYVKWNLAYNIKQRETVSRENSISQQVAMLSYLYQWSMQNRTNPELSEEIKNIFDAYSGYYK